MAAEPIDAPFIQRRRLHSWYFSVCLTAFKDRKMLLILKMLIFQIKVIIRP